MQSVDGSLRVHLSGGAGGANGTPSTQDGLSYRDRFGPEQRQMGSLAGTAPP